MKFRRTRPFALASALALLGACQAPQSGVVTRLMAPTFRMQAADAPKATHEGRAAVTVTPAGVQPGGAATTPLYDGELTVKFAHLLGDRKLMATVADVKSLTITLSGNGVSHTETISEAMIVNGMTSFTFSGLPAGSLTVTIKAMDSTGKVIGTDIQQATVTAGQTTVVASTVMIVPTVTQPQVIVTGGSGGSGSGGATGTLTTTVTLVDGAPVQNATLVAAYTNSAAPHAMAVVRDNQGNTWFTGGAGLLKRVSAAGAVSTLDMGGVGAAALGTSADGAKVYVASPDMGYSGDPTLPRHAFNADGTPTTIAGSSGAWFATVFAGAADGTIFTGGYDGFIFGIKANGTFGFGTPFGVPSDLQVTSTSEPVYSFPVSDSDQVATGELDRFHADGTLAFQHLVTDREGALAFALDGQDNAWYALPSQSALRKLSPTGVVLGTYPLPVRANAVAADAAGRLWAFQSPHILWTFWNGNGLRPAGAPDDLLMRIGTDGRVLAYYHLGLGVDVNEIVVTADDHLWVASPSKGLLHYTLPPAPSP